MVECIKIYLFFNKGQVAKKLNLYRVEDKLFVFNSLKTEKTLNSEDPDEMPPNAAFHLRLHFC